MSAKDRPMTMWAARICYGDTAVDRLNEGLCPLCGVKPEHFTTEFAAREFEITGLCQECQDKSFQETDQ